MEKELPKGWVETTMGEVVFRMTNGSSSKQLDEPFDGCFPISRIETIAQETIDFERVKYVKPSLDEIEKFGLKKGDILFSHINSDKHLGKTAYFDLDDILIHGINLLLIRTYKQYNSKFLNYLLRYYRYTGKFIAIASHSVNQSSINQKKLNNFSVIFPPKPQQERIVAKLDSLFAELERVKEGLAKIPLLMKSFRQAVLTQAVTGKLTQYQDDAQEKVKSTITIGALYEKAPSNWKWVKLVDVAKLESGHTPRKTEEEYWVNGNVPWISLQDIRAAHGKIIHDTKYMPNELGIKKSSARLLPKGTVCFCRDISVGYTTVMGREMSTTQHFANWICGSSVNNMFLLYSFMAAKDFLVASGKGTTVGTIYMPALKELRILLPPLKEQQEIVRRVEDLFAKADAIEARYTILKEKIHHLPQAILDKAFRGDLVEQLPTDGDARELLEDIKKMKSGLVKGKKMEKA